MPDPHPARPSPPKEWPYLAHIVPPMLERRGPMTCLPRALHRHMLPRPAYLRLDTVGPRPQFGAHASQATLLGNHQ